MAKKRKTIADCNVLALSKLMCQFIIESLELDGMDIKTFHNYLKKDAQTLLNLIEKKQRTYVNRTGRSKGQAG